MAFTGAKAFGVDCGVVGQGAGYGEAAGVFGLEDDVGFGLRAYFGFGVDDDFPVAAGFVVGEFDCLDVRVGAP